MQKKTQIGRSLSSSLANLLTSEMWVLIHGSRGTVTWWAIHSISSIQGPFKAYIGLQNPEPNSWSQYISGNPPHLVQQYNQVSFSEKKNALKN